MGIDHDVVLRGLLDGIKIVIDQPLTVVMLSKRQNVTDIATLHGIVAILFHKTVGGIHVSFIITHGRRGLVMHEKFDTLRVGIVIQSLDVEIRVRCHEIEHIVLVTVSPILPADIPALHKHLVETVPGREVNVLADILVVGRVPAVRLGGGVVGDTEMNRGEVVRVGPGAFTGDHFPPDTHIFHGMNP